MFHSYNSLEEVKTAYTKIDSGRSRNFVDKINALEILKDKAVPKKLTSKLSGIFSIINADFPGTYSGKRKGANDQQAKIDAVNAQVDNVVLYGNMLSPIIHKSRKDCPLVDMFLNPGTAASIIHLMSNDSGNEAFNFFSAIISGAKLDANQTALLNAFNKLDEKNSDIKKSKLVRIVEKVWNAHVNNETLTDEVEITDYKSVVKFAMPKK
ncbi:MAG: hypothetical protein Q8Q50_09370 [Methylobacter sp.]|nr:hypothetical protein [Methylobacter sp.]